MRFHLSIADRGGLPPCQSITVGKLDFRRYTTVPSKREGLPDQVYMGAVGEYTEADVAAYRERVSHLVVRWGWREANDGARQLWSAQVYDKRISGFFPVPERDEPLEKYLSVQRIDVAAAPEPAAIGSATPEQVEALAAARSSEDKVRREDPSDQARRARHGRAKASGEGVEG